MILSERVRSDCSKWLIAIVTVFIVLGTFNSIFALAGLLACIFNIVVSKEEDAMCMLVFLLPFSNIFKLSPSAQTFYTYIILFYVLYKMIVSRKIYKNFLVLLTSLILIIVIQAFSSFDLFRSIKLIANVLLIYIAMKLDPEKSHKGIFLSFVFGVVASSLLSIPGLLPNLSNYVSVKDLGLESGWLTRFSGMYGDPNYYSINVIVSMCILVLMWHKREINPFMAVGLCAILVYFAVITYSRSAFLMLALPLILFLYSNMKSKKYVLTVIFGIGAVYLAVFVLAGKIQILETVLSRFTEESGDVTSGRTDLWGSYLSLFLAEPLSFLFGRGLGAELVGGKAPHNTYIDFLYYLGLVGMVLYILAVSAIQRTAIKIKKRNIFNYSLFICIGVMYFFISEIFYIDFPFHIIVAFIACNMSLDKYKNDNLR